MKYCSYGVMVVGPVSGQSSPDRRGWPRRRSSVNCGDLGKGAGPDGLANPEQSWLAPGAGWQVFVQAWACALSFSDTPTTRRSRANGAAFVVFGSSLLLGLVVVSGFDGEDRDRHAQEREFLAVVVRFRTESARQGGLQKAGEALAAGLGREWPGARVRAAVVWPGTRSPHASPDSCG